jgi:hypothetical protein
MPENSRNTWRKFEEFREPPSIEPAIVVFESMPGWKPMVMPCLNPFFSWVAWNPNQEGSRPVRMLPTSRSARKSRRQASVYGTSFVRVAFRMRQEAIDVAAEFDLPIADVHHSETARACDASNNATAGTERPDTSNLHVHLSRV